MHVTYGKNILRTIKSSLGRFTAIFAIVALGVGFLVGLLSSTPDMRYSFDKYFDERALYDIRISGSLGFSDDDIAEMRAVNGVETVQAAYTADVMLRSDHDNDYAVRLHSLSPSGSMLNKPSLTEGRLPEKAGECVLVNVPLASKAKLSIGSVFEVSDSDTSKDTLMVAAPFTVVGFVNYSPYFSGEKEYTTIGSGTVDLFLLVSEANFLTDFYTDVFVSVTGARALTSLTEAYQAKVDETAARIQGISGTRGKIRYMAFMTKLRQTLKDAKADYVLAERETNATLLDTEAQLTIAEKQISSDERQLAEAWTQIAERDSALKDNEKTLTKWARSNETRFADAQAKLDDAQVTLDQNLATVQKTLADAEATLQKAGLTQAQQAAFAALRALPVTFPTLTNDLVALRQKSATLATIGAKLSELERLSATDQVKYASAAAALSFEQTTLQADLEGRMSGDAYTAYAQTTARLAASGAADTALPALAMKLAAADVTKARLETEQTRIIVRQTALEQGKTDAENALKAARAQLDAGKAELAKAKTGYFAKLNTLGKAKATLTENKSGYDSGKTKAELALAEAKQKLDTAAQLLEDTTQPTWTVSTRASNNSCASIGSNIDKVHAIAKIFPFFFILVSALVALTTMTRMVEAERLQIGTMKALGYSRAAIAGKYLLYALTASVLGSIVGVLVGFQLFPGVIWNAYTMMYALPKFYDPINPSLAFTTSGAVIACVLLATLSACRASLKEKPAQLMRVKAPEPGKRVLLEHISPIWRRMKFTQKVTARNLFRYKKRFFMTTIGVAGCTALLVAGFGLHDAFADIPARQFGVLQRFDILATYADEAALQNIKLQALLSDRANIADNAAVSHESLLAEGDGKLLEVFTFIAEKPEDLDGFITLRARGSGETLDFEDDSVIITEKASEILKVAVGGCITLISKDGARGRFTVSGICENYLRNYVYMTEGSYEKSMGIRANQNLLLLRLTERGEARQSDIGKTLLSTGAVRGISYTAHTKDAFALAINKIDTIVIVIILCAGALALVVLYNLTNINISERAKELATIKVLGFTDREVYAYINRESMLLSLIGTAFGLGLGVFLHRYVISSAELSSMMFGRVIDPWSFVWSAALTMAFSLLVDLVMRLKLRHISMVESMKAPE